MVIARTHIKLSPFEITFSWGWWLTCKIKQIVYIPWMTVSPCRSCQKSNPTFQTLCCILFLLVLMVSIVFIDTGGPRYMRSFYLWIRVSAIENWPFFCNLSPNLQSFLVFLYANSLYTSLIFRSLSIANNEVEIGKSKTAKNKG